MTDLVRFQLRRLGRNRQYLFFSVLLPALFTVFFTQVFGGQATTGGEYQAYARESMVSMMAYGALGAALGATVRLAFDRQSGWLRQLRVSAVPPGAVLGAEVVVGALLVLPSLVVVALVGRFVNGVQLDAARWAGVVAVLWAGSVLFVALGLVLGLLLDSQAAGAAIGVVGVVLAALGGLWVPTSLFPSGLQRLAEVLPSYWYAELGRAVAGGAMPSGAATAWVAAYTVVLAGLAWVAVQRRPLHAVAG